MIYCEEEEELDPMYHCAQEHVFHQSWLAIQDDEVMHAHLQPQREKIERKEKRNRKEINGDNSINCKYEGFLLD